MEARPFVAPIVMIGIGMLGEYFYSPSSSFQPVFVVDSGELVGVSER